MRSYSGSSSGEPLRERGSGRPNLEKELTRRPAKRVEEEAEQNGEDGKKRWLKNREAAER